MNEIAEKYNLNIVRELPEYCQLIKSVYPRYNAIVPLDPCGLVEILADKVLKDGSSELMISEGINSINESSTMSNRMGLLTRLPEAIEKTLYLNIPGPVTLGLQIFYKDFFIKKVYTRKVFRERFVNEISNIYIEFIKEMEAVGYKNIFFSDANGLESVIGTRFFKLISVEFFSTILDHVDQLDLDIKVSLGDYLLKDVEKYIKLDTFKSYKAPLTVDRQVI